MGCLVQKDPEYHISLIMVYVFGEYLYLRCSLLSEKDFYLGRGLLNIME